MDNVKKKKDMDIIMIILLILGAILILIGLFYNIPSREFNFYSIEEYVGGDAYNGIIEASIRGGEIAGATMSKNLYICSGSIIMALGLLKLKFKK